MRKYVLIGCGGFLGAVARYWARDMGSDLYWGVIPLSILLVNLLGAFLLAFLLTFANEIRPFSTDLRLGLSAGFLGAFTTFSTLCKEAVGLMQVGDFSASAVYLTASVILGLSSAYVGVAAARRLGRER